MTNQVVNVVLAGLGGQGVVKASDIVAEVAFRSGLDVKKAEIHGMSQRGGSVSTDVRFGPHVLSPMVPTGQADFLVVVEPTQIDNNRGQLKPGGMLIDPSMIDTKKLRNTKTLNVALLGVLSAHLDFPPESWKSALSALLPEHLRDINEEAFDLGRNIGINKEPCP
ncbi:MAG: 2-oxoacid:acceptor oxidoreductase family protein [Phycisphaerales bacterium]|nr:2-oxoacid:acceptor oxidoreductase family protein [Phycisphaerales bacterium]